jgi:hypothetical protein
MTLAEVVAFYPVCFRLGLNEQFRGYQFGVRFPPVGKKYRYIKPF